MKKQGLIKKFTAAFLISGLLAVQTVPVMADLAAPMDSMDALAASFETDYSRMLGNADLLPAGDSVSDWLAFLAGRVGEKEMAASYLARLEEYVSAKYKEQGGLDPIMATSWHRLVLDVAVLGGDPTAFGTDAEGNPVNLVADGCYNFSATDSFDNQGLNAWLYALIALDSNCYKVPSDAKYTRESILARLVEAQEEDGGFGLIKGGSDVDMTAMVLQALAPYQHNTVQYQDRNSFLLTIGEVTEKALNYLSEQQQDDGGYLSYETPNSESCSQVIIALCSLGIDPETDDRFVKNGNSVVNALEGFLKEDGTYSHDSAGSGSDAMATQQAAFAAIALDQYRNGQRRLFDLQSELLSAAPPLENSLKAMSDEEIADEASDLLDQYETIPAEERSYVYSFGRVIRALKEQGKTFDEETTGYYDLNEKLPVAEVNASQSDKSAIPVPAVAAIAAVIAAGAIGGGVVAGKNKNKKTADGKKKVHW